MEASRASGRAPIRCSVIPFRATEEPSRWPRTTGDKLLLLSSLLSSPQLLSACEIVCDTVQCAPAFHQTETWRAGCIYAVTALDNVTASVGHCSSRKAALELPSQQIQHRCRLFVRRSGMGVTRSHTRPPRMCTFFIIFACRNAFCLFSERLGPSPEELR